MNLPRVLILAGGLGTRLKDVSGGVPKPLVQVGGRPFLDYLLEDLANKGFQRVTLVVGYKKEMIRERYANSKTPLQIDFVEEEEPLGTGGALKHAIQNYPNESEFLSLNGDTFFGIDFENFLQDRKGMAKIALSYQLDTRRYGRVEVASSGVIQKFLEKPKEVVSGDINGGIIWFKRSLLSHVIEKIFSFEKDVLEKAVQDGQIYGMRCEGHFIDMGTPESLKEAEELMPKWF
ncbi:MAG: NTP transferase domain-containing protein [Bdellovibrionales bacterium]|nr:NTP transferase domain-containing protein [Bdellovibrionales bacterium]